jgi:flavin reductase (DIM6/NTAB) family NADH-FMN oxidoreductase RutF
VAAITVAPPRIAECYQQVECRVHEIIRPSSNHINIIANALDISADAGLYGLPGLEQFTWLMPRFILGWMKRNTFMGMFVN